eukprot:6221335-Pyramimonas_sp.AAC.1
MRAAAAASARFKQIIRRKPTLANILRGTVLAPPLAVDHGGAGPPRRPGCCRSGEDGLRQWLGSGRPNHFLPLGH